jgi:hypothetical protein
MHLTLLRPFRASEGLVSLVVRKKVLSKSNMKINQEGEKLWQIL